MSSNTFTLGSVVLRLYILPDISCARAHTIALILRAILQSSPASAMAHATVAGLLASAFVGIAKDMLSSAIAGQAALLCNLGVDLEDMEDMLEDISAVLEDAERRSIKEKLVQLWLKRLKNVSIDISDMLDDYQDIRDQTTPKVRTD